MRQKLEGHADMDLSARQMPALWSVHQGLAERLYWIGETSPLHADPPCECLE